MEKLTKANVAAVYSKAMAAAKAAQEEYLAENSDWYPCGFAWVLIKPARGLFVSYLKSINEGGSAYGGGYQLWSPGGGSTQVMNAKYEAAHAFVEVLKEYGVACSAQCRMD